MFMDAHNAMTIQVVGDAVRALGTTGFCPQAIDVGHVLVVVLADEDGWEVQQHAVTNVVDPVNYETAAAGVIPVSQVIGVIP